MADPYAQQTAATFLRLAKEDEKFIAICSLPDRMNPCWNP